MRLQPARRKYLASVRVKSGIYPAAAFSLSFAAYLLWRSGNGNGAQAALVTAWLIVPLLALTERVYFDGQRLTRRGLTAVLRRVFKRQAQTIAVCEIEWIETGTVRLFRRGGMVRYRYHSEISGNGVHLHVAAGGRAYRRLVRTLFPLVPSEKLDVRSLDLRDYLCDARHLRATRELLRIAPPAVLEDSLRALDEKRIIRPRRSEGTAAGAGPQRASALQRAANELRVAGRLSEAGEAFRRALLAAPYDGWLIYGLARLLHSQAGAFGKAGLARRSVAALRLAARHAGQDAELLLRIGESLAEHGELNWASRLLNRAIESDARSFRAAIGLAELALNSGKLAHVVHHYRAAQALARDPALARFAAREADYYLRLSADDDYLDAELRRLGWLQNTQRARHLAARVGIASGVFALGATAWNPSLAAAGWALASSSAVVWMSVSLAGKFFAERSKARSAD